MTSPTRSDSASLICHPATPCPVELSVQVRWSPSGVSHDSDWALTFELRGDVRRVRVPPPAEPGPRDGLWKTTCFELFMGTTDGASYQEFNFSPSGEWAHYTFEDERKRQLNAPVSQRVRCSGAVQSGCLIVKAQLPTPVEPAICGFTAVIELDDGTLTYWALHHPDDRPDFHRREGWILTLPARTT